MPIAVNGIRLSAKATEVIHGCDDQLVHSKSRLPLASLPYNFQPYTCLTVYFALDARIAVVICL